MTSRRGFTLSEILMGMALFALILVTALGVLHWALLGSQRQQTRTRAAFWAQQRLEDILAEPEPATDHGACESEPNYRWNSLVEPKGDDFLTVKVTVTKLGSWDQS